MIQTLVTILTILAAILTILAGMYTIYFGIQKTGTKVKATFSIVAEKSYETRISNVVLQNKKDLPVCIYKVLAIFDDKTYLELKKFDNILVYEINGLNKTAFFHPLGSISQEWNLGYNAIGVKNRELNDDDISLFLQQHYSEIIKAYEIHLVDKNSLKTTFVKRHIPS